MNEKLSNLINHPKRVHVAVGIVSFGVGVGVGLLLGRKNKSRITHIIPPVKFDHEEMGKFIEKEEKRLGIDHIETPEIEEEKVDAGAQFVAERLGESEVTVSIAESDEDPEEVVVRRTIFATDDDDWDYAVELKGRTEKAPYVIHKDEFYAEESGYTQITLTYYAGDNIMSDEDDTPVYNHETVVGPMKFGHGSGDPKIFYIRNDSRKAEYEIVHDEGLYSVEVLGLQIEDNARTQNIRHSHTPKFDLD